MMMAIFIFSLVSIVVNVGSLLIVATFKTMN